MALPISGPISANNIRTEIGKSTQTNFSIKNAETGVYVNINQLSEFKPNGTYPHRFSEWMGYNHSAGEPVYTIELRGYTDLGNSDNGTIMTVYKNGTAYLNSSCYSYAGYSCSVLQEQILAGDSFYLEFKPKSYFSGNGYSYFTLLRVVYSSTTRGILYDSGNYYAVTTSSKNFPEFTAVSGENITISVTLQ